MAYRHVSLGNTPVFDSILQPSISTTTSLFMSALLAALNCANERHLLVGNPCTMSSLRVQAILKTGARPIIVAPGPLPEALQQLHENGKLDHVERDFQISDLQALGRPEVDHIVDKVFVSLLQKENDLKLQIYATCGRLRIPINTTDSPEFCSFTLLATHSDGDFQMGVTTSGKGCKLAARIRRELTSALPSNIGAICQRVGELRTRIQQEDNLDDWEGHDDDSVHSSQLNKFVDEFNMSREQRKQQRARWLSQIVEYYPLLALADISVDDLSGQYRESQIAAQKHKQLDKKGSISLVGAGPGAVSLLTVGALHAIYTADLVLADKLVPQQVLDLIPKKRTQVFIARKFPGNAEKAQEELLSKGLESIQRGEKVVRLKQGDPYVFGRGGEEYRFFAGHGYIPEVIPGITSALAAPVLAGIPATHRDVADQVLICTGTGRRGALPVLPEFVESRTTVFLMALHRIADLVPALLEKGWDPELPVAVVERASCPDQRVVRTRLGNVARAIEECGSRPPGLLVTGRACEILFKQEDGEEQSEQRVEKLESWTIEEGIDRSEQSWLWLSKVGDSMREVAV